MSLYPTKVINILENWHYPLVNFMNGIESYFGTGVKDQLDGDTAVFSQYIRMKEFHLYGASRLGILNQNDTLKRADLHFALTFSDPNAEPELFVETQDYNRYTADSIYSLKLGNKLYEGTNHLGNVVVTFSDKRLATCVNDTIYHYRADLRTANDYAAFGAALDDRRWYSKVDSGVYRFGFNGQEKDNEIYSSNNGISYENRVFDPRLGRFLSIDPLQLEYPWRTPYNFAGNSPILYLDQGGLQPIPGTVSMFGPIWMVPDGVRAWEASNPKTSQFFQGFGNFTFGLLGTIASTEYIIGSGSLGASLGGAAALNFSLGEMGLGYFQMIDVFRGEGTNTVLHKSSSLLGLTAHTYGYEHADLVNSFGQLSTGLLTGGLIKPGADGLLGIYNAYLECNGPQLLYNGLSLFDHSSDILDFTLELKTTLNSSETNADESNSSKPLDLNSVMKISQSYFKRTEITYTIKKGDTLGEIAKSYNTTVDNLAKINGISNPDHIIAGATIKIK